jgi:endonuclease III
VTSVISPKSSQRSRQQSSHRFNQKKLLTISIDVVLPLLKKKYPDAHCALHFKNPFELLIATILSAQCTDERVNKVTAELFKVYPDPQSMGQAPIAKLEKLIHSAGFYKNKAKNIKACSQQIVDYYNGQVPANMESLVELPGVGRKTANVVMGNAFGIASGVVVDTHVTRLAKRWGWVKTEDAVKIELKLNKMCDQSEWVMLSHYMISHGRSLCKARSPDCENCFLMKSCPKKYL